MDLDDVLRGLTAPEVDDTIEIVSRVGEAFAFEDLALQRVPAGDVTITVVAPGSPRAWAAVAGLTAARAGRRAAGERGLAGGTSPTGEQGRSRQ